MRSLFRKIREANRPFCTALVAAAALLMAAAMRALRHAAVR